MGTRAVFDTNVLVAAMRSRRGASHALMRKIGTGAFDVVITVAVVLEYEMALERTARELARPGEIVDDLLDYLCAVGKRHKVHFLWRPRLRDPDDEMVLEAAVAGNADYIVTHNARDFRGAERFGVKVVSPSEFLKRVAEVGKRTRK